jgi:hypothetical protein
MGKRYRAFWALAVIAACVLLLAPALWNGFPLLQWDTGGYLARPFEGYLVPSRSTVYGLFVAAGTPFNFWPIVAIQAAATIWVVAIAMRVHGAGKRALRFFAVVACLAIVTTLPFIAAILITDIFTGLSVLALHILLFADDDLRGFERAGLVALIAFAAASHSATLAVLLGLMLAAFLVRLLRRDLVPIAGIVRNAAALALGAAMLLTANFALSGRLAWTPGGFGILFGRMLQDGIVARYLEDHCPDPRLTLCPYRAELPRNADAFLWGSSQSVFNRLGRFVGLGEEMQTIVLGSLKDYPLWQLKAAITATASQIVSVRSGEGVLPTIWHTYAIMERYTPSVVPAMRAARQRHHAIDFETMNRLHIPVALVSMALLPAIMLLGWRRRRFADLGLLAASVTLSILVNAVVCGTLSDPHDRYGARIVWVATFVVLLTAIRLAYQERNRTRP